jgi:diadenosine tetraphosphate (Ap4A) HIT family hydrolase
VSAFSLHPQLAADTVPVVDLALSRVLLMDDARWPWLVLVPRRAGLVEFIDLPPDEAATLWTEARRCGEVLSTLFRPDKLNLGALGNLVPQLHVHVIARHRSDPRWPQPVWGAGPAERHRGDLLAERLQALRIALA